MAIQIKTAAEALTHAARQLAEGCLDPAEALGRRVLMQGGHPGAWHLLASIAERRGRLDEARVLMRRAIRLVPNHLPLLRQFAALLRTTGPAALAVAALRQVLILDPSHADGHAQLGISLIEAGDPVGAEVAFRRALTLDPTDAGLHANVGGARRLLGDPGSDRHTRAAVVLQPDAADSHFNLGVQRMHAGHVAEAVTSYRRAVTLRPDFVDAHWNLSLALLANGCMAEGWREYEWRLRRRETPKHSFPQSQWRGEEISDRTILLHAEQGHGDTLQFVRYAPLVAAKGARVLLVCQPALQRLLANIPEVDGVYVAGDCVPAFDVHCPLMSLPLAFHTDLQTIPTKVPYLHADPALLSTWEQHFTGDSRLRVGLVWAGDPRPADHSANLVDRRRSVPLSTLAPLGQCKDVMFVNLQKGGAADQIRTTHPNLIALDLMDMVRDFADTAALISNLDLVIAVDTAVAHLAGALGKPVWVLSRFDACWRWLRDRDDSLWYPTMRLFRQEQPGAWQPVVERVRHALSTLAADHQRKFLLQ